MLCKLEDVTVTRWAQRSLTVLIAVGAASLLVHGLTGHRLLQGLTGAQGSADLQIFELGKSKISEFEQLLPSMRVLVLPSRRTQLCLRHSDHFTDRLRSVRGRLSWTILREEMRLTQGQVLWAELGVLGSETQIGGFFSSAMSPHSQRFFCPPKSACRLSYAYKVVFVPEWCDG